MSINQENQSRDGFGSKLGIIAAAAGSAIGLGNIWKFPYVAGKSGGGAFLLVYILCVVAIGLPIMLAELIIGRKGKGNAVRSIKELKKSKFWPLAGWFGVIATTLILSFYYVVAGWTLSYVVKSATGVFTSLDASGIAGVFDGLVTSTMTPIVWSLAFMAITGFVVIAGIQNGIEKYSKILMPLLFIIIIILDIRAITLPGAKEGLDFLFKPDFTKLKLDVVFSAMSQAFFSLSLGMGIMITYGSYINDNEDLGSTALQVSIADTLIAILAGVAIFPAVFAYKIDPATGAGLAFKTLPNVFNNMPFGQLFGTLFFILLAISALTSTISLQEVVVAFLSEEFNKSRKSMTILSLCVIAVIGVFASLSNGLLSAHTIIGHNFMDFLGYLTDSYMLPLGGIMISLFVGWAIDKKIVYNQLQNKSYAPIVHFLLRFVCPIAIAIVFLKGIGVM